MRGSREASKRSFIKRYLDLGYSLQAIFDVGVNERTPELITCCPNAAHHLFEPCKLYNDKIAVHYKDIKYSLYNIALGAEDASMFMLQTSLKRDGVVTHSRISPDYKKPDGASVISCDMVEIKRLDTLFDAIPAGSLLKVDVDGSDLDVIKGCGNLLSSFTVIIIESALHKLAQTVSFLEANGFELRDIVDRCYYHERLWQVDLVFFRKNAIPGPWDHNPSSNFQRVAYVECI